MDVEKIVLDVKGMDTRARIAYIVYCNIHEEGLTKEEWFKYGVVQGIRLANGEIDRVLQNRNNK